MPGKNKIIISCNPSGTNDLLKKFKGSVTCRSSSTKMNISEIPKSEGYEKDCTVLVVGSGPSSYAELFALMKQDFEKAKFAFVEMGEAGMTGAMAGMALKEAFKKIKPIILCPEDMMIMNTNMDFSKLERIVLDSITIGPKTTKFAGRCYYESGEISKRTYKMLMKRLDKAEKVSHKQNQTDRWCNKWDRKIKRKL